MRKWNLTELYKSFECEAFKGDIEHLKELLEGLRKYPTLDVKEEYLKEYLIKDNELVDLEEKLFSFVSLTMSADTQNQTSIKMSSVLETILASFADVSTAIQKWIGKFDLSTLNDEYVKEHMFALEEIQSNNKYLLDEASETVLANMKASGSSAWLKYKNQLISSLNVTVDGKDYSLTEVLNMAYSSDKEVRKKAYEAEVNAYGPIELGVASALNAIKGEAINVANMRGYGSVLNRTLVDSRMSQKTLDVLLSTMKKALPLFERFYQCKARALGYTNGLPWYEMYAPVVDVDSSFPFEKGAEFVIEQFTSFSKTLGNYAKTAIENEWIDVYPRKGKVGGAFCNNLHCIKQSRFLLNYGEEFGDVITMAHELGHGFHGYCLNNEHALNSDYPMPIAETASNFCETIVKKAALKNADLLNQINILENELSDCAQVIVDIYSRFLFESRVIEKRKEGPLSVDEIKDTMIQAQKEAYGNGLDHNYLHPYMWTWKSHYYRVDLGFYNFPYAFGLLLAKGLYGMYKKEGEAFPSKYEEFLSRTGKMTLEDVGASVGINLQSEAFWKNSIDMIEEDIGLFESLLETLNK